MPIYDYKCTNAECGEVHTKLLKFSERGEYEASAKCETCGSPVSQIITAVNFVGSAGTKRKGSSEFRDILNKMHKDHPGSKMNHEK